MKPGLEKRAAAMRAKYRQQYRGPHRPARDPETREEWQGAVDRAELLLAIGEAGELADLCASLLERGRERGIRPAPFDELARKFLR